MARDKFVKEILGYMTKTKPTFELHIALKRKENLPTEFLQLPSKNGKLNLLCELSCGCIMSTERQIHSEPTYTLSQVQLLIDKALA